MKFLLRSLCLVLAATAASQAQQGPGWFDVPPSTQTLSEYPDGDSLQSLTQPDLAAGSSGGYTSDADEPGSVGNSADVITPEIQALADGLGDDPVRIFLWVRNNVRYVHYYGCKKGAALTLWEKAGNDADQSALLVALFRAAGTSAQYVFGPCFILASSPDGQDLTHLLGVDGTNVNVGATAILAGGTPLSSLSAGNGPGGFGYVFYRWWVQAPIQGTTYYLDPSFKPSDDVSALVNVATASGYSRSVMLSAAGGTPGTNSITGVSEGGLDGSLNGTAGTLLNNLSSLSNPNIGAQQAFGGRNLRPLVPASPGGLGGSEMFPLIYDSTHTSGPADALPTFTQFSTTFFSTIHFQLGAVGSSTYTLDKTLNLADLQGQRLSLTFTGSGGAAQLWLEDTLIATESPIATGSSANLTVTINHPTPNTPSLNQTETKTYLRSGSYALVYGFDAGPDLLNARLSKLTAYQRSGASSQEISSETLNVIGLSWLRQTELASQSIRQSASVFKVQHHRFGRVSQESNFYVDVGMQTGSSFPRTAAQTSTNAVAALEAENFIWSAMEHGVLAQMQSALEAVSTVKLISMNNAAAQPTYLATNANWASVQTQLTGYSSADITKISATFSAAGTSAFAVLPKNGSIAQNQWSGAGYVLQQTTSSTGLTSVNMQISGNLSGGYNTVEAIIDSTPPIEQYQTDPPVAAPTQTPTKVSGGDPVNMATGYFTVDSPVSLTLDNRPLPRGIAFTMRYDGSQYTNNNPGLGYGWDFNLDINLTQRSDTENALGLGTPSQAAAAELGVYALLDLCNNLSTAKDWTVAQLVAKWIVDPFAGNSWSLTMNGDAYEFQALPDGTYAHPVGSTLGLQNVGGQMQVSERHGNVYTFDGQGRLSTAQDLWGKTATFTYDAASGKLNQVQDAYSRVFNFTWTGGQLASVTEPQSSPARSVTFGYDATTKDMLTITDPEGKSDSFSYDTSHHLTVHKDGDNRIIIQNTSFDSQGRVTQQYGQGSSDRTWNIHYAPGLTQVQMPIDVLTGFSGTTQYQFDSLYRPIARTNSFGYTQQGAFDSQNQTLQITTALGRTPGFSYDGNLNMLTSTDRYGQTTHYTYDGQLNLFTITDPRGSTITCYYNSHFQLTKTLQTVDGQTIEHDWGYDDTTGALTSTKDPDGYQTIIDPDGLDRPSTIHRPDGTTVQTTYTTAGDPWVVTDARGNTTTYGYNNRRELASTSASATTVDGTAQTIATARFYDNNRNLQTSQDALGYSTQYTYSSTKKLLTVQWPTNSTTSVSYGYNTRDELESVTNALGQATTTEYDQADHPLAFIDPLGNTTWQFYDADDRPSQTLDALGRSITASYNDGLHSQSVTDYPTLGSARSRNLVFDGNGNLATRTNGLTYSWQMLFNEANQLKTVTSPEGRATGSTWYKRGLLNTVTPPSGNQVTYHYDSCGRLQTVNGSGYSLGYAPDHNGNPLTVTETVGGVGRSITRTFDEVNRVKTFTNENGEELQYLWDANGNLQRITYPDGKTVTYGYDQLNRLTSVTDWASRLTQYHWNTAGQLYLVTLPNGAYRKLTYDTAGRLYYVEERLPNNRIITTETLGYDAVNCLHDRFTVPVPPHWQEPSDTATFDRDNRYLTFNGLAMVPDADGNLPSAPLPDGPWGPNVASASASASFIWDTRDRLTSATRSDTGTLSTFGYDPEGRLDQVIVGGVTTRFTVNPHAFRYSQILVRTNTATGDQTRCVYGLGLLYEERPDGSVRYFHYDHQGNTVALTDDSASITGRAHYSPYGGLVLQTGDILSTSFLFNGAYGVLTDQNTGLLQMRARFYNPRLKRFLNEDPSGFAGGWNFFAYADGNPVSLVDPFGLGAESGFWNPNNTTAENSWLITGSANNSRRDILSNDFVGPPAPFQVPISQANEFDIEGKDNSNYHTEPAVNPIDIAISLATSLGRSGIEMAATEAAPGAAQITINAARGNAFEAAALDAMGATKNTTAVTVSGLGTSIPDVMVNGTITEIKDVVDLSFTSQLQIQAQAAKGPFNLIVSPRTQSISMPLQRAVQNSGGTIQVFDSATKTFRPWP